MKIVAHRGASRVAPENTMSAFLAAGELGADGIELDVHATADGGLVVIHDDALERTTTGAGLVFESTSTELARLDAGRWFGAGFAGEPVPFLDQVLGLDGLEFELELKTYTREAMLDVLAAVEQAGVLARTEFTSSNTPMVMALKEHCPEARIGMFCRRRGEWMAPAAFERSVISAATFSGADVVHVYACDITPGIVERLHQLGHMVHATDATAIDDVSRAVDSAADQLSTDDLHTAVRCVRS